MFIETFHFLELLDLNVTFAGSLVTTITIFGRLKHQKKKEKIL